MDQAENISNRLSYFSSYESIKHVSNIFHVVFTMKNRVPQNK